MKKRAGKRYDYRFAGHCIVEGEQRDIQIFNISTSGIQFGSHAPIATNIPIQLIWDDDLFGKLEPTLLIAREVLGSEYSATPYLYGAQYYNLNEATKHKLLLLLKNCKKQLDQHIEEQVKKDTKNSLSVAMSDGETILRSHFKGEPIAPILKTVAEGTKYYERKSFDSIDLTSICIQKLTIHNFQCQVLVYVLKSMLEKSNFHIPYLKLVDEQMAKISISESSIEGISKETTDIEAKKLINESSNRLFYTKQTLLQGVIDSFPSNPQEGTYEALLNKLKSEYEKLLKVVEIVPEDKVQKFSSLTEKPADFSLVEAITDIGSGSTTKRDSKFGTLPFSLAVLGLMGLMFSFRQCYDFFEARSVRNDMHIPLKISKSETYGNQINIFVSARQWMNLPINEQHQIMENVREYLAENDIYSCTIYGEENEILQVIYKEQ